MNKALKTSAILIATYALVSCNSVVAETEHPVISDSKKTEALVDIILAFRAESPKTRFTRDYSAKYIKSMQEVAPDADEKIFAVIAEETDKVIASELEQNDSLHKLLVPIYTSHFSEKEIDELVRFFNSEVGKKVLVSMPDLLMRQSLAIENWGMGLGPRILANINERVAKESIRIE